MTHHSLDGAMGVFPPPCNGAGAPGEHAALVGRAGGPRPAELAVERGGAIEHAVHMLHVRHIPAREVAVKRGGAIEHVAHIHHV